MYNPFVTFVINKHKVLISFKISIWKQLGHFEAWVTINTLIKNKNVTFYFYMFLLMTTIY